MKPKLLFSTVITVLLLTACSNDEKLGTNTSDGTLVARANGDELALLQNKALENLKQKFLFNADSENVSFTSKSGVVITINPSRLTINGAPVSGNLTVEYIEIFDRADMVTANKATMGIPENADEGSVPLKSGGELFLDITQEGQSVDQGSPYQLIVPVELTGGGDDEMILWKGEINEDGDLTWEKDLNEDGSEKDVPIEEGGYVLDLTTFSWCNIDAIPNTSTQVTRLYVDVPDDYNFQNSKIYLAYQGEQNILARIDMYDNAANLFYEHGEYIPVGTVCNIIFVSGSGGSWEIAVLPETIGVNGTIVIDQNDIHPATQSDVENIIHNLP